ncbi:MAG: isoprenylcysteine carboxylmethyltransferase family protein [Limisphaerales bacterium]
MSALVFSGPADPGRWHSVPGILAGALLFLVAAVLGVAGVIQLGRNRTPYPEPRADSVLVRDGVYAWCRHPLYASVIAGGLAWALIWQSGWTLALAATQIAFFHAKSTNEERRLRRQFPEYADYARRVKRFVPGLF